MRNCHVEKRLHANYGWNQVFASISSVETMIGVSLLSREPPIPFRQWVGRSVYHVDLLVAYYNWFMITSGQTNKLVCIHHLMCNHTQ